MGGRVIRIYENPEIYENPDTILSRERYWNFSPEDLAEIKDSYREDLAEIKRELKNRGLPEYDENKMARSIPMGYDYDFEIRLDRDEYARFCWLVTQFIEDPNWVLPKEKKDFIVPSWEERYTFWKKYGTCQKSHILGMPEEGYYLPLLFSLQRCTHYPRVGSAIAFQAELREMALRFHFTKIELDTCLSDIRMPDSLRLHKLYDEAFAREKYAILALYVIATASIHYGQIIQFR